MIDFHVIEKLDAPTKELVKAALVALFESGIFELQEVELQVRLGAGAQDESDEKLLASIQDYRRKNASLVALRELGKRFKKDSE